MKSKKREIFRRLLISTIAVSLCLTAIQIGANTNSNIPLKLDNHEILEIKVKSSKYTPCPFTVELKESCLIKATRLDSENSIATTSLATDIPVMVFGDDIDAENPSLMTDGAENIVIGAETWEGITANIELRYSNDGGDTWLPEDGTFAWNLPDIGIIPEMPEIDYAGNNGGFGSYLPVDPLSLPTIDFDIISDPEAGEGWTLDTWTTDDNMVDIDSVDVGGINSQFSPDPYAKGIVLYTGDGTDGTTNVLHLGWQEGTDTLRGLWTGSGDLDYEWEKTRTDNDLSTGMHYEAFVVIDNSGTDPEGVEIDWCTLDGTGDWWEGEWYYTLIPYADNPDISACGGNCFCVYELDDGIECTYSNDNGESFQSVIITTDGQNPRISVASGNVVCCYTRNGDVYTVISEDNGESWEETRINDVSGSVVEQPHCAQVSGIYSAWTDNRDGVNGIYLDKASIDMPIIEIGTISGGMGISAEIKNTGSADANDVSYSISATGGILGKINKADSGTITVTNGGQEIISLPMIIGLGKVSITVTAGSASKTIDGTQILVYTN